MADILHNFIPGVLAFDDLEFISVFSDGHEPEIRVQSRVGDKIGLH